MINLLKKQYFLLANLLIVGLMIYYGINIFFQFTDSKLDQHVPEVTEKSETTVQRKKPYKPLAFYLAIAKRNLFNTQKEAVPPDLPPIEDTEKLPDTELNLKLWGTSVGQGEKDFAVIEDPKERVQNLYRRGQTVQNAVVKMIFREKVILSVNGKDQKLEIEKAGKGVSKRGPIGQRRGASKVRTRKTRSQKITLKRALVETSLNNTEELMSQVNIRPHFNRGKPDGIMLTRIKPKSLFRKMGLRNGDVVTGVNGENIEAADDVLKLYDNMKTSETLALQIKRRGRSKTIEYTIK